MRTKPPYVKIETLPARFWKKVNQDGPGGCWLWTGFWNPRSYGQIATMKNGKLYAESAHRVSWELHNGPIPAGMFVDHACRNNRCVNPAHLRVVPPTVNTLENNDNFCAQNARKPRCKQGHLYTPENTALYVYPRRKLRRTGKVVPNTRPARVCLTCFPSYWKWAIVPRDPPQHGNPQARGWATRRARQQVSK